MSGRYEGSLRRALTALLLLGAPAGCAQVTPSVDTPGPGGDMGTIADALQLPDLAPAPLGNGVILFWGEGGVSDRAGSNSFNGDLRSVKDILSGAGSSSLATDTLPADISGYRLIIWYMPGAARPAGATPAPAVISKMRELLGRGGRLVLASDRNYPDYTGSDGVVYNGGNGNAFINLVLTALGASMTAVGTDVPGCATPAAHPLLAGVGSIAWNAASTIQAMSPAVSLCSPNLAVQRVAAGELLLIGDNAPVSLTASSNPQLIKNLVQVPIT